MPRSTWVYTFMVLCLLPPVAAFGQAADRNARLTGFVTGSFGDGGPAPTVGLTAGYPLASRMRVELDASYVRNLDFGRFFSCPPEKICVAVVSFPFTLRGEAISVGGNVVAELPGGARRIRPYVLGGAGVAHIQRTERFESFFPTRRTLTSTGPLLTAGAGVDFLLGSRVALGVDVRYRRLFEKDQLQRSDIPPNLDLTRIGSSIGYRF
jgi:opacity protein-like surface antigen